MSIKRVEGGGSSAAAEAARRAAEAARQAAEAARRAAAEAARQAAEAAARQAAQQHQQSGFEPAQQKNTVELNDTRAPATSLLSENAKDGDVNCLDKAADWVSKSSPELQRRSELVFLGDTREGAEGQSGHVVVRQGERVVDPSSGKSYADMKAYLQEQPQYREVGTLPGTTAAKVFATEPGSPERASALADAKVSPELQRMMVADSPVPGNVPNPATAQPRKVQLPGQAGPVTVEFNDKLDKEVTKKDGFVTVTLDAETSISASGELELKKIKVGGGLSSGSKMSYEVKMKQEDFEKLKRGEIPPPHPLQPSTLPDKASIKMEQTQFKGTSMEAGISHHAVELGMSSEIKKGKGMSIEVSRDGDKVQVTAGPTDFIENDGSVSIGAGPVSVSMGRTDSLTEYKLRTAEFDLSSEDGRKAFDAFRDTGKLPTKEGPGVANTLRIDKVSYESEGAKLGLDLGPFNVLEGSGTKNTGEYLVTHHADGTKSVTMDVTYGGDHPEMTYEQRYGKDGKPIKGSEKFALKFDTKDDNARELLVLSLTGDKNKAKAARANDKPLTLELTANDVKELQRRAAAQPMAHMGLNVLLTDYDDKPVDPFMAVRTMACSPTFNQYKLATEFLGIYQSSGGKQPVPGHLRFD